MTGQRFGHTDGNFGDRIFHRYSFFADVIVEEDPDRLQVARDGLGREMPALEVIHIGTYLISRYGGKRDREPSSEVHHDVQIGLHRLGRVVLSF